MSRPSPQDKNASIALDVTKKYKQIFDHASDAIAIIDTTGHFLEQNDAHRELLGYKDKEILHKATPEIHLGKQTFKKIFQTLIKTGEYRGEVESTSKTGQSLYIELVIFSLKDIHNKTVAFVGIKRDITLRKKVEEELYRSKQQLEIFFRNAADGITVQDAAGQIVFANDTAAKSLGYNSVKELLHTPATKIMKRFEILDEQKNPFPIDKLPERLALQGKLPEHETVCFRIKETNEYHWAIVKATPIFNSHGKVQYVVNVFTDITNRMQIETALRESEERYRKLVNLSPLGIAIHQNGKLVFVNPAYYKILGADSAEEVIGKSIMDFLPASYHQIVSDRLQHMMVTGNPADLLDEKYIRIDGSLVDVEVTSIPFIYQGALAFQVVIRDITDQKKLLQQKDDFLAISSHELKTPLTSIKAFTQLLERQYKDQKDSKALKYLTSMTSQVDRLKNLVDDLLDVSKIQTGKLIFNEEVFMFDRIVEEIITDMQPLTKHHTIEKKGDANIRVFADKYRIGQVLTNLITNAIKYSPNANKIIVTTSYDNEKVVVAVKDFGIGIPKSKLHKIFDRFYRVEGAKRESYPGLGLGLYISSQIMQRHNGKLWVKSEEKKGTTFYFSLPITLHARFVVENSTPTSEQHYL